MSKEKVKYKLKQNNYIGLLFFALVLASTLYIIKHETETPLLPEPTLKAIDVENISDNKKEIITQENDEILTLRSYLNKGDLNTFKIYQSMYNSNEKVNIDNINEETMLYIAYKYIVNNNDLSKYTKYLTCDEATTVGIEHQIYQCGGSKNNLSNYTVNTYITKDILKATVQLLFNRTIYNFTNFYTTENNLCYYINNEYLCIDTKSTTTPYKTETSFIKAYKYNNKIEIIENYKFIKDGIYYTGFNSDEVGEGTYISTFIKKNGTYYWESTKYYSEAS